MRERLEAVTLLALACASHGCLVAMSFDEYDASDPTRTVGGTVEGLEGQSVRVTLNGQALDVRDGPFVFPSRLSQRAPYLVGVESPLGHECDVQNGSGIVTNVDVRDVVVRCPSTSAELAEIALDEAPARPNVIPGSYEYRTIRAGLGLGDIDVALAKPSVLSAKSVSAFARITSGDAPAGVGSFTMNLPLRLEDRVVQLDVVAPTGRSKRRFDVHVQAREAEYIKPSNTRFEAAFGTSVALAGDVLVVGAPNHGDDAQPAYAQIGAVYVFRRQRQTWKEEARFAGDVTPNDVESLQQHFGAAVALSRDVLFVGVPGARDGGEVQVYRHAMSGWSLETTIRRPLNSGLFGAHLLAVDEQLFVLQELGVDIFEATATGWQRVQRLNEGGFGFAVSGSRMAIRGQDAVRFFRKDGSAWIADGSLTISRPSPAFDLALFEDRLAIGYGHDGFDPNIAGVLVYRRTTTWELEADLIPPNLHPKMKFGDSVALDRDVLLVGAPGESNGQRSIGGSLTAEASGAAYVFRRDATGWSLKRYLKAQSVKAFTQFGSTLAIDGEHAAISAPFDRSRHEGVGAVDDDETAPFSGAVHWY